MQLGKGDCAVEYRLGANAALALAACHEPGVCSMHLRNPLSPSLYTMLGAASSRPSSDSDSGAHCRALELAVLGAILWIGLDLGLDPSSFACIGVGFEIGYLATVVGEAALGLIQDVRSAIFRKSECLNRCHEGLPGSCSQRNPPKRDPPGCSRGCCPPGARWRLGCGGRSSSRS